MTLSFPSRRSAGRAAGVCSSYLPARLRAASSTRPAAGLRASSGEVGGGVWIMAHCSRGRLSACGAMAMPLQERLQPRALALAPPCDCRGKEARSALTRERTLQLDESVVKRDPPAVAEIALGRRHVVPRQVMSQLAIHCNRSEEHTSELQSLMRISYAVFCLKKK